jgi:hypothetical protein
LSYKKRGEGLFYYAEFVVFCGILLPKMRQQRSDSTISATPSLMARLIGR